MAFPEVGRRRPGDVYRRGTNRPLDSRRTTAKAGRKVTIERSILAGWLLVTGTALPLAVFAQPAPGEAPDPFADIPNVSFAYYDVSGTKWDAIAASLAALGPRHGDGSIAHGRTEYRIAPSWTERQDGPSCRVTNVEVKFSAVVLLPRLAQDAAASAQVRKQWQQFIASLRRHEAGHARIAFEHVGEVKAAVAASACETIQANAGAALAHIEALQQDYDRRTQSGRAQGDIVR